MGDHVISSFVTIATAIVGVAVIAVIVSKNAQTGTVLTSAGTAFASALSAATAPVTGTSTYTGGGVSPISVN